MLRLMLFNVLIMLKLQAAQETADLTNPNVFHNVTQTFRADC